MPIRDPDDLVDSCFNRLMQSLRFTFISGVFGGILTVCSFLAIPFTASLPYYHTAILVCVLIGVFFLALCFYCFRAWRRLRLNDVLYNIGQQRIPRSYESTAMRDGDASLGEISSQSENSSLAHSETISVYPSSGDIGSEVRSEESLPSTSTQKPSDIKSKSKEFFHQQSIDILKKSSKKKSKGKASRKMSSNFEEDPEKLIELQTESIEETHVASASKLDISKVSEVTSISDGSMPSRSDSHSTDSYILNVIANIKEFCEMEMESSDTSSSTENESGKYKKDTRSSSESPFDSEKAKMEDTGAFSFKQELSSKGLDIKRSHSEKDVTSDSKAQWPMKVHDSSRSGKRVPETLKRRASAPQADLGKTRTFSVQERFQSTISTSTTKKVQSSSSSIKPSAAETGESSQLTELSD
ncbi:hypothetical protein TNCT_463001 [Trichonephila clavata]|uniref:Uncharacterized protein n=1 Tax=Trichonephila clavata TaxID=2740835 RepID=A0A8X6G7Z3_TRICU|nr:hypothetical protein TNCT_463001 [Trichonephila clavata]